MCGINGFLLSDQYNISNINPILDKMIDAISHRGPDDSGKWIDNKDLIGFGHRRLSILDLSKNGLQPMFSHNNRYIISYNGEIYNHLELRKFLINYGEVNWKSTSDTETLIESINLIGLENTLNFVKGMFAFALYDKKLKKLNLVRDRFGEKPLYYGWSNGNFLFASELFSIEKFNLFEKRINLKSLNFYTQCQYVPAPYTIYENIFKVEPGKLISLDLNSKYIPNKNIIIKNWWSLNDCIKESKLSQIYNKEEILKISHQSIKDSVKSQMISDVPIGSFLSGGIDSTLITSVMNTYSNKQLKTFTIGLKDKKYDESVFAKKIANYLGTEHHEFQISEKDMLNQISNILSIYDEPFADSSQIPTSILSRFAKKEVSVILTGDGGDEIFGGYNRYIWAENLWKKIYWIPPKLRSIVAKLFLNIPLYLWSPLLSILYLFKSNTLKVSQLEDKIYKISMKLRNTKNFMDLYFSLITEWKDYDELFIDKSYNYKDIFNNQFENINLNNTEIMMSNDSLTYLPDDILYKVDRSAMSYGLETRVPFLDTEVTKLAWRVPISEKIDQKNKKGKTILRNLLNEYMPSNLYDRSKMGFSIPLANWIKNGLREFTFDNLNSINIKNDGYFDHKVVQKFLDEHMSGKRNWQYKLWSIIVFQNWLSNRKT